MRRWILLALVGATLPAYAELTPDQKQQDSKTVDKELRRMDRTGRESGRLKAMIPNGTPDQKHEYGKLLKKRDAQDPASPWGTTRAQADTQRLAAAQAQASTRAVQHPSDVEGSRIASNVDCPSRPHPELDPSCKSLLPRVIH